MRHSWIEISNAFYTVVLHVSFVFFQGSSGSYCYQQQSDFIVMCQTTFNGVVDGGRCFYVVNNPGDWYNAWNTCRANGSVAAQVHTLQEQKLVENYVVNGQWNIRGILMALRDDKTTPPSGCALKTQTAYWFDDVDVPNTLLSVNNTLAKYYPCADTQLASGLPRSFALTWSDDNFSETWLIPFCQINNEVQTFTRTGYCMTETPIEALTSATLQDCANLCAHRTWCRSFNYQGSANSCQFFSRSVRDASVNTTYSPSVVAETSACSHYNYV